MVYRFSRSELGATFGIYRGAMPDAGEAPVSLARSGNKRYTSLAAIDAMLMCCLLSLCTVPLYDVAKRHSALDALYSYAAFMLTNG